MRPSRLALLLSLLAACTASPRPGDDDNGGDTSPLTPEQFVQAMMQASCDLARRCVPELASYLLCESPRAAEEQADFRKGVDAGRVQFDGAKARACINALKALACEDVQDELPMPPACREAMVGTVATAGNCWDDPECAAGWCDDSTCPGKCKAFIPANGSCPTGDGCAEGLRCVDGKCITPKTSGSCTDGDECAVGLYCRANQCQGRGTATSGTCEDDEDCAANFYCKKSSLGAQTGTCTALLAADAACGLQDDCANRYVCRGASINMTSGASTPGKCAPVATESGACTAIPSGSFGTSGCALGLVCAAGTCQKPPTSGACAQDFFAQCDSRSAYCDEDVEQCKPLKADNAACESGSECQSGDCQGTCKPRCRP